MKEFKNLKNMCPECGKAMGNCSCDGKGGCKTDGKGGRVMEKAKKIVAPTSIKQSDIREKLSDKSTTLGPVLKTTLPKKEGVTSKTGSLGTVLKTTLPKKEGVTKTPVKSKIISGLKSGIEGAVASSPLTRLGEAYKNIMAKIKK